jgi:hypothetical protein
VDYWADSERYREAAEALRKEGVSAGSDVGVSDDVRELFLDTTPSLTYVDTGTPSA